MSKGDFKPVVTIYDTETQYVTRKGFEKLMKRVEALEKALAARDEATKKTGVMTKLAGDEARGAPECECGLGLGDPGCPCAKGV